MFRAFRRQWLICSKQVPTPPERFVEIARFGDLRLLADDELLHSSKTFDQTIVTILGRAINLEAPQDPWHGLVSGSDGDVTAWLRRLCGHYTVIVAQGSELFLYTDPAGTMGVYFDGHSAASTPILLPGVKPCSEASTHYGFNYSDDWYPGDRTPFDGVKCLMANHRLRFSNSSVERFWPRATQLTTLTRREAIERIAYSHRTVVEAYASSPQALLSLTGGKESRMNLAAARRVIGRVQLFSIDVGTSSADDIYLAAKLAEKAGANHTIIPNREPSDNAFEVYDATCSGMSVGTRRNIVPACAATAAIGSLHISGVLGDYLKSQFWPSQKPSSFDTRMLLKEFCNQGSYIKAAIKTWEQSLPADLPVATKFDLMYFEQRGGRWAGIGETGCSPFFEPAPAFSNREMFELMQSFPREAERMGTVHQEIIAVLWPELLEIPFRKVTRNLGIFLPKKLKFQIKALLGRFKL